MNPTLITLLRQATTPVVCIQVVATRGSTPRNDDAMMLVTPTSTFDTIGGGHLEMQAIEMARTLMQAINVSSTSFQREFILSASLGQCCGGVMTLQFDLIPAQAINLANQFIQQRQEVDAKKMQGSHLPVMLFGAGHVGQALVQSLAALPFSITWVDNRPQSFPSVVVSLASLQLVSCDHPEVEVQHAPENTAFLVMTHDHALDKTLCEAIFRRRHYRYFGLIGSQSKRQRFERVWQHEGFIGNVIDDHELANMRCPIGLRGIIGKTPAIIAASVTAELLQVRSQWLWLSSISHQAIDKPTKIPHPFPEGVL